jgi:hypothetical protein
MDDAISIVQIIIQSLERWFFLSHCGPPFANEKPTKIQKPHIIGAFVFDKTR